MIDNLAAATFLRDVTIRALNWNGAQLQATALGSLYGEFEKIMFILYHMYVLIFGIYAFKDTDIVLKCFEIPPIGGVGHTDSCLYIFNISTLGRLFVKDTDAVLMSVSYLFMQEKRRHNTICIQTIWCGVALWSHFWSNPNSIRGGNGAGRDSRLWAITEVTTHVIRCRDDLKYECFIFSVLTLVIRTC